MKSWFRIANKSKDETDVYIYDEIGLWGITANDFVRELQGIETKSINLHLNSPGGEVFDGIAIYNALRAHPANVNVSIDSLAASAASFIAQAGDRIKIAKTGTMMIHEAAGLAWGPASEMRKMAEELDMMSSTIAGIYADRAGETEAVWRARMETESWYRGQEAVDIGLADEVEGGAKPANATPARFWNLAEKFKNVPEWLRQRPQNAGRTMSQANLDKLHDALAGLEGVHLGTCDMADNCPMASAGNSATAVVEETVTDQAVEEPDESNLVALVAAIISGTARAREEALT